MAIEGTIRRILLTRMKFIGDIVLTTPIIRALRQAYPEAYLAYLGEARAVSLLEHNPYLDEILPFDFSRPGLLEQPRITWLLRRKKFDLAIDLFGNPRSALLTYLSNAPIRVGPARRGRGRLYTIEVQDDGHTKSAIDFHYQSLRALGIPPAGEQTEIFLTEKERQEGREMLAGSLGNVLAPGGKVVALHPGATWPAKRWGPERFAALAERLQRLSGLSVVFTSGPGEEEILRAVLAASTSPLPVLKHLTLRHLAAVLAACSGYVTNDAGPMHISVAVGTPTVGLFGPGEEEIWFPYQAPHQALRRDVPCHPCHLDFCNRQGEGYMECMKLLNVDDVVRAMENALREGPQVPVR
jgi:lipopolysaccharide heptosyltransferase II